MAADVDASFTWIIDFLDKGLRTSTGPVTTAVPVEVFPKPPSRDFNLWFPYQLNPADGLLDISLLGDEEGDHEEQQSPGSHHQSAFPSAQGIL